MATYNQAVKFFNKYLTQAVKESNSTLKEKLKADEILEMNYEDITMYSNFVTNYVISTKNLAINDPDELERFYQANNIIRESRRNNQPTTFKEYNLTKPNRFRCIIS